DALTPLAAGRLAADGDAIARAKLSAVIRVREQLAARPATAPLYAGYPFDRLRRRLGLEPDSPTTTDPADFACMSSRELAALDPTSLPPNDRAEAARSAHALGDPDLAARFPP